MPLRIGKEVQALPRRDLSRQNARRAARLLSQPAFDLLGIESVDPLAECDAVDRNGRRAIFIHVPKAAGTSLRAVLGGYGRTTHLTPGYLCSKAAWANRVTIVAVRHPLKRFASSYRYHVLSDYRGALLTQVGPGLKTMSPLDYARMAARHPRSGNFRPQIDFISRRNVPAKLILRAEDSETWGARLREHLPGVEDVPRRNVTQGEGQDLFGGRLAGAEKAGLSELIRDLYEADFRELCYEWKAIL
jgi:hypothetical protein